MKYEFIIGLTEHRVLGYILTPYLICPSPDGPFYKVTRHVIQQDLNNAEFSFSEEQKELVRLIENYSDERLNKKFSPRKSFHDFFNDIDTGLFTTKVIPYVEQQISACIDILRKSAVNVFLKEAKYMNLYDEDRLEVQEEKAKAIFNFERDASGIRYNLSIVHENQPLSLLRRKVIMLANDPCCLVYRQKIYTFEKLKGKNLYPFLQKEYLTIPRSVEEKYFSTFIINIVRDHKVNAKGFAIKEQLPAKKAVLSLEAPDKSYPMLTLYFHYGNSRFCHTNGQLASASLEKEHKAYCFYKFERDRAWEDSVISTLRQYGLKPRGQWFVPDNTHSTSPEEVFYETINRLNNHRKAIEKAGIAFYQSLPGKKIFTGIQQFNLEVKKADDWFDIHAVVSFGSCKVPFIQLKRHILNGIREYELPNGEIAILPREWFSQYHDILPFTKPDGDSLKLHKHHYNLLKERLQDIDPGQLNPFNNLDKLSFNDPVAIPTNLKATLRPYQDEGFAWMYQLRRHQFGGCLADDMGLGKTLQTLSLLLKIKQEQVPKIASLIIVPTSLIHNWSNELRHFTPDLNFTRYVGVNRKKSVNITRLVHKHDVVLTTYGTIRNDYELLSNFSFHYLILDESQYIKNPLSKTYKAVISLKAKNRLVLTGTPIENSLADLWSQVNFLNPGLLGSLHFFKRQFITPIEKKGDEQQEQKLQTIIHPFILRRTKEEVANDLPPVTEQTRFCTMTEEQESVYEEEKSVIRNTILRNIESFGIEKSAFVVLQGLTRLRQLANHPALLTPETPASSGKFNEIIRCMGNLMAENHKVLVFSSFVKHLNLLGNAFREKGWKYTLLTGQTRDREEVINTFQHNDDTRIFLISLKAGGVGLNLTSADYVFIIDPWWNPAAESQAINRAHRIGQDKKVFVYRFISQHTIEEKIQLLKEKKSVLAQKFINLNNPFKEIDKSDVIELFK